ncbi:MAG TPA: hypothetical protein DHW32_07230 [Ruminococcaceae bacterium]|nr:hypothetical protein [Oscillospiraceae bacterium]HCK50507.1 hypothetical protein [Oscillospiraceae bacterium]
MQNESEKPTAIGLSMDDNMRAELCAATVENTAAAYTEFCGAVLHSDRGSQYTSASYRTMLNEYGVKQSMNSAGGRCHDNARCESIRGLVTRMKNKLFYTRGRRSTDCTAAQKFRVKCVKLIPAYQIRRQYQQHLRNA